MQFRVPQFIDIEDKVFGPLTWHQFIYLAGGAGGVYLSFKYLPGIIAFFVALAVAAFAVALAFYKYNEKPFIHFVESFIKFYTRSRLYLWHKQAPSTPKQSIPEGKIAPLRATLTESKLKTLSWSLDVINTPEQKK